MRHLRPLFICFFLLLGCGKSAEQEAAEIVTSTQHCGTELVHPDLMMRLSGYQKRAFDSNMMWVVQACHPKGGCEVVLTYRDAPRPIYSVDAGGALRIEILGGVIEEMHRDRITLGGVSRRIHLRHLTGPGSKAERSRFRARMGQAPRNAYGDRCDPGFG